MKLLARFLFACCHAREAFLATWRYWGHLEHMTRQAAERKTRVMLVAPQPLRVLKGGKVERSTNNFGSVA